MNQFEWTALGWMLFILLFGVLLLGPPWRKPVWRHGAEENIQRIEDLKRQQRESDAQIRATEAFIRSHPGYPGHVPQRPLP